MSSTRSSSRNVSFVTSSSPSSGRRGASQVEADFYVSQNGSGDGSGRDPDNRASASWFNTSGNWGAGSDKISPGNTVALSGTITTTLSPQGDGTSGNEITILWESGAKLSQPAGTLINATGRDYIIFDGGTDGVIENTDNGSELGNQIATSGIIVSTGSNLTVRNITFQNLYVHTLATDSSVNFAANGAVYCNGFGSNLVIHDCTFSDICWVLNLQNVGAGASGIRIYNNTFLNYDHGVALTPSGDVTDVEIYNNTFGATAAWDTDANAYHHDGIHTYWAPASGTLDQVKIYNNLFNGDWGNNNTAMIYMEQDWTNHYPSEATDWQLYNNVFIQEAGNLLNNGFVVFIGDSGFIANNTFVGAGVANQSAIQITGSSTVFKNNLVSGVKRFVAINGGIAASGLDDNLYANVASGGVSSYSWAGGSETTLSAWQTASSGDASSSQVPDAVINGNGVPQTGSDAIDNGQDLSGSFTTDYNGATRSGAWDIGAYSV